MAIAFFYAVGTGLGGILGPALFGKLIASKSCTEVMVGFLIGGRLAAPRGRASPGSSPSTPSRSRSRRSPSRLLGDGERADEGGPQSRSTAQRSRAPLGRAHWSPRYSFHGVDDPLDGQVAAIERALDDADRPLPGTRAARAHERAALGSRRRAPRAAACGRARGGSCASAAATSARRVSTRRARRCGATRARACGRARTPAAA